MSYSDGNLRTRPTASPGDLSHDTQRSGPIKPGGLLRRPWFIRVLGLGALLAIWQLIALGNTRIPGIAEVVLFFVREIGGGSHRGGTLRSDFWGPLGTSLQRYGIGLAIGIPGGVGIGLLIGASAFARALLNDTTLALLALPSVVWAFLSTLWFGLGNQGPVLAVVLTVAPFIAVSVSNGVRNIDKALIEMSLSYKVPLMRRAQHLILGGTISTAFTGLRLAFMAGWNSLLIMEWFGTTEGVGSRAKFLYNYGELPGFVSWILLFIVLIMLLDRLLLRPLERRAFRWNEAPLLIFEEKADSLYPPVAEDEAGKEILASRQG